jgi:hypothetical protein
MIHCDSSKRTDSSIRFLREILNESELKAHGRRDSSEQMDSSIRPEGELTELDRFS